MERQQLGADESAERLTGAQVSACEFVQGETEDEDYIVLHFSNGLTLYGNAPSVYADVSPVMS
jgi:hypothetical protein